jgi:hypothetical protein
MTSQGRDVIRGIKPMFVYQSSFPNYFKLVEVWEVEENTNINMLEKTNDNYLRSSKYAKA